MPRPANAEGESYLANQGSAARDLDLLRVDIQAKNGFDELTANFISSLNLPSGQMILEVGSGAGSVPVWLAKQGHTVIAVDNDPKAIKTSTDVIKNAGVLSRVALMQVDARELELADGSVDHIHMRLLLQHLTEADRKLVLEKSMRMLAPGGLIIAEDIGIKIGNTVWHVEPPSPAFEKLHEVFMQLYDKKGTEPDMGPQLGKILGAFGLEPVSSYSYGIVSKGDHGFKRATTGIFGTVEDQIVKTWGLMTKADFDLTFAQLGTDIFAEGAVVFAPTMYGVAYRKRAAE
jgi:ubiquinone/menaquinone biosynthesis C-methylase UbiE